MDTTLLALLALLAGVIIGAAVCALVVVALRMRDRARVQTSSDIPDGVRDVLHAMDDAALVVDSSTTVLASSSAAVAFGLIEGSVVTDEGLRALVRRARDADSPSSETMRLRRGAPPAELRLVSVRAARITLRLSLLVLRDITERERVEEMRRDFVANTSHELKTPVGAVTLLAEAIESASDDPEQVRTFAGRLTAEAARLAQLTSRIMNLSRLQSADELTELRVVAVDEIVAAAVDANGIAAASAGVEITRGGDRGIYVTGDTQILSEALSNLVANGIAYSPRDSRVGVGVKVVDDTVEIAVTDRGIGIAEGDQERVFERFYRADEARSRRTGGTGLGLSIVKHAVQRHGGEVRLWSRPGRGSTFTICLPVAAAPADLPPRTKAPKKKRAVAASVPKSGTAPKTAAAVPTATPAAPTHTGEPE